MLRSVLLLSAVSLLVLTGCPPRGGSNGDGTGDSTAITLTILVNTGGGTFDGIRYRVDEGEEMGVPAPADGWSDGAEAQLTDIDPGFYEIEAFYSECDPGWMAIGQLDEGDSETYTVGEDNLMNCWGR
jgi:hypothetical protein